MKPTPRAFGGTGFLYGSCHNRAHHRFSGRSATRSPYASKANASPTTHQARHLSTITRYEERSSLGCLHRPAVISRRTAQHQSQPQRWGLVDARATTVHWLVRGVRQCAPAVFVVAVRLLIHGSQRMRRSARPVLRVTKARRRAQHPEHDDNRE